VSAVGGFDFEAKEVGSEVDSYRWRLANSVCKDPMMLRVVERIPQVRDWEEE
jgi:hypothetical protein